MNCHDQNVLGACPFDFSVKLKSIHGILKASKIPHLSLSNVLM